MDSLPTIRERRPFDDRESDSVASYVSFKSLPSISSRSPDRQALLRQRRGQLREQSAKIEELLAYEDDLAQEQNPVAVPRRRTPFGPSQSLPHLPRTVTPAELPDDWLHSNPRPWRSYLFRNLTRTPLAQVDFSHPLRKPTPMRWGYPGTLSHVTPAATAFAAQRRAEGANELLSGKQQLAVSLVTYSS